MILTKRFSAAALVLFLVALAWACDNDTLNRPFANIPTDRLFTRYVSVGNSITAGFQSGGINDSTQVQSYAVLLAQSMHTPFFVPLLQRPGCPNPIDSVFRVDLNPSSPTFRKPHRINNTFRDDLCALRIVPPTPPPFISNVAVPGAKVLDAYVNLGPGTSANPLTTFVLGGLTQVQAMRRADPTFVTVWIGNNDVLGAATRSDSAGDTLRITSAATFTQQYNNLADSIEDVGPQGAVLIGVANVTAIPYFSKGSTYWAIKNGFAPGAFPPTFTVDNNCAPASVIPTANGDSTLVPFPYGGALLTTASAGGPAILSCFDTIPQVVVRSELRKLGAAVLAYNATISGVAAAHNWVYLDPNVKFAALAADTAQVRPFPYFPQGNAGDSVAVRRPFGRAFSRDAVHPSASTHRLLADTLQKLINANYGTAALPIP
jgi:lysophospholipase L1-like esterase